VLHRTLKMVKPAREAALEAGSIRTLF